MACAQTASVDVPGIGKVTGHIGIYGGTLGYCEKAWNDFGSESRCVWFLSDDDGLDTACNDDNNWGNLPGKPCQNRFFGPAIAGNCFAGFILSIIHFGVCVSSLSFSGGSDGCCQCKCCGKFDGALVLAIVTAFELLIAVVWYGAVNKAESFNVPAIPPYIPPSKVDIEDGPGFSSVITATVLTIISIFLKVVLHCIARPEAQPMTSLYVAYADGAPTPETPVMVGAHMGGSTQYPMQYPQPTPAAPVFPMSNVIEEGASPSNAPPGSGHRFDPHTGKPIPKFDPYTGVQNWS